MVSQEDRSPSSITIPKPRPLWVAWVTGQFLFCVGVVLAVPADGRVTVTFIMAGLSFMLDCVIVAVETQNIRERKRRG